MRRVLFASVRPSAGKTGILVGVARALGEPVGYMKPLGDRLSYRRKRLWDLDAAAVAQALALDTDPEVMTMGFDPSKLRYMYDATTTTQRLTELADGAAAGANALFIEGGRDLAYGASVHLDALSVARQLDADVVLITSGDAESVVDDFTFFRRRVDVGTVRVLGLIANRLPDADEFRSTHARELEEMNLPLLGAIPNTPGLGELTVATLAERLFAKVIAGEKGLDRAIGPVVVGAMSAHEVLRLAAFRPKDKLVITSGDRSDMILAALESGTVGIILSNGIVPPPNILSRASIENVPLLLAPQDTFKVAERVHALEPLLTGGDPESIGRWRRLVETHLDVGAFAAGVA